MADDLERIPLNKWNLLSGALLTLLVLGIGVTFLFIGIFEDIEDLVILGSIFLVFTVFVGICVFSTVIRPYIKSGRVEDEDFTRSYKHESVGFSRSDNDLKSTAASFERIRIDSEEDGQSIHGQRRAESVIVDVKSRANSAHSLQPPTETYGQKKRVTFY